MFQILRACKYEHIEKFVVYGERHSGTTFLESSLRCFNMSQTGFFGHKHWMGFAKPEKIEYTMHIMFVCIVRNPYEWITAFFDLPHHIPLYKRTSLKSFMLDEWYSVNSAQQEILEDRNMLDPIQRYKNIFEMRDIKNQYMINVLPNLARNFVFVKYEDLFYNYNNIMYTIQNKFHLKLIQDLPKPTQIIKRNLTPECIEIVNQNINWKTENSIGYFQS